MAGTGKIVALIKAMAPGVDPSSIEQAVTDWLDDHPEATTTVEDGSITEEKLAADVLADLAEIEELNEAIENKADAIISSASGTVATFTDGADNAPIASLEIQIMPTQSGTGTPSPENVRAIVGGVTGCNLYQSGEDDTNPETTPISWESQAGTIYIGTLNVITGVLKATHAYKKYTGASSEGWVISSSPNKIAVIQWSEVKESTRGSGVAMCNMSPANTNTQDSPAYGYVHNSRSSYNIRTHIIDENMTVAQFKTWLSTHNLELICPLTTPLEYTITGVQMNTLLGVNKIWTNVGSIKEVVYRSDTQKAVEKEVQNSLQNYKMFGRRTCAIFEKVCCIGDSYTAGYIMDSSGTAHTSGEYSWVKHLANITGREYVNCGVGGKSTKTWLTDTNGLAKAQIPANKAQAYTIGLQINDAAAEMAVGTTADIGTQADSYIGYMSQIIDNIFTINGDAHVFLFTQPKGNEYTSLNPYQQAIRDIVTWYQTAGNGTHQGQVHLIDLVDYATIFREAGCWDSMVSGHLTPVGYEYVAEIIEYAWSQYLNAHPLMFQDVNLIPYGTST